MKKLSFIYPMIFMFLSSCMTTSHKVESDFKIHAFQEEKLENGLTLIFLEDNTLPRISFNLMIKSGSLDDQKGKEGSNYLTAMSLEQGTTTRSATQMADDLGQIASDLVILPADDFTSIVASSVSTKKERLLELFSDAVINPSFTQNEIERIRANSLASVRRASDNPTQYADQMLNKVIYRGHPYSIAPIGEESSLVKITRSDIVKKYFRFYRPNNSILTVSGHFDSEFRQNVKKVFSSWQKNSLESRSISKTIENSRGKIFLFTKPDLKQTEIRWGFPGIERTNPDFLKLRVATMILGGDFTSRLNMKVRDELGLTYSIHSQSEAKFNTGNLEVSTFTRNDKVKETIQEAQKVLQEFYEKGINKNELDATRTLMQGQFPMAIETTDKLAFNLMVLRLYGVSDDYLTDFNSNLQKLNLEEINQVIKKYYNPADATVVVYGDEIKISDQLKKFGEVIVEKVK